MAEPRLAAAGAGPGGTAVHLQDVSTGKRGLERFSKSLCVFVCSHSLTFLLCRLAWGGLLHQLPQWHMGLWL